MSAIPMTEDGGEVEGYLTFGNKSFFDLSFLKEQYGRVGGVREEQAQCIVFPYFPAEFCGSSTQYLPIDIIIFISINFLLTMTILVQK